MVSKHGVILHSLLLHTSTAYEFKSSNESFLPKQTLLNNGTTHSKCLASRKISIQLVRNLRTIHNIVHIFYSTLNTTHYSVKYKRNLA